jgi:hypothetical protein
MSYPTTRVVTPAVRGEFALGPSYVLTFPASDSRTANVTSKPSSAGLTFVTRPVNANGLSMHAFVRLMIGMH